MLAGIQNYYERLVLESIQKHLAGRDELQDADFVADLACLALNALPARYVRHAVDLWSHLCDSEQTAILHQVDAAVDQALAVIGRRQDRPEGTTASEPVRLRLPWI
ncbi:late competence development ComFB family protein [Caldichromatium japonicum]|uniref:Late competence development ComFB family protein n=1 Tax=Caldichromatium japonicum TaxID=2699430 RepID=A0A6G7VGD1_9GAMM|nr:late competence development ComFB family protein [Caldichromatium japonicum]QIK38936.1 late competence development ComFB family protein [Caldichromatium japonicum]